MHCRLLLPHAAAAAPHAPAVSRANRICGPAIGMGAAFDVTPTHSRPTRPLPTSDTKHPAARHAATQKRVQYRVQNSAAPQRSIRISWTVARTIPYSTDWATSCGRFLTVSSSAGSGFKSQGAHHKTRGHSLAADTGALTLAPLEQQREQNSLAATSRRPAGSHLDSSLRWRLIPGEGGSPAPNATRRHRDFLQTETSRVRGCD